MSTAHISISDRAALLKKIGAQKTALEYANNQAVFAQGDAADSMFYIESGNVKLSVLSKRGKKAVLAIVGQGDFFGEGCVGKRALRMSTATAIHQSTISRVTKSTVVNMIHADPAFAKLFVAHLLSRIGRIEEDFVDQLSNSSEKRLARTLWLMASSGKSSKTELATLKISQGTLAQMIGTTRSRVSFFMNRFRKMGLINYNGTLRVHRALLNFLLQA
ncbi:MAG TPA: Crp/Fnr family transcriptional regulator [Terriglobales bacterium]|jgi:CRP/FNR family transcriptional regulator, cyclic AMP receptor protein|nr:Crp/Fnr family transcriptional regulator [Terriglobales bacterium]